MSVNTIWNEEIERGLKAFLQSFMLYSRGEHEGEPIKVIVRKPDDDFYEEEYPVIFIQQIQESFSTVRYDPTQKQVGRTEDGTKNITIDAPLPFDLAYQIDFYALYQTDINEMTRVFLSKTHGGRYFNLDVLDREEKPWNVFALRRGRGVMTRRDVINSTTRLFHTLISYQIRAQIDEAEPVETYTVLEVAPDNQNKEEHPNDN